MQQLVISHCYPSMLRTGSIFFFLAQLLQTPHAQVSVYGFYNTYEQQNIPLILGQYEAISGEWLEWDTLDFAGAVVLGSSAFHSNHEQYMFSGLSFPMESSFTAFWTYNVIENNLDSEHNLIQAINGIQHDLSNDRFFGIRAIPIDSTYIDFGGEWGYWEYEWGSELVELLLELDQIATIAPMDGINGVVPGATAYDSDNAIYAFVGMDENFNQSFYQFDTSNGMLVSQVALELEPNFGFNELECFIEGESYIGIKRPYGNGTNPLPSPIELVSVDPYTGSLTTIIELPQIHAFTPNASVFDQETGLYVLLYYDESFSSHVIVIDPVLAEVVADHSIVGTFIELQINNREFAASAYGTVDIHDPIAADGADPRKQALIFPNPGRDIVRYSGPEHASIYDANGRFIASVLPGGTIAIGSWKSGIYYLKSATGIGAHFLIER